MFCSVWYKIPSKSNITYILVTTISNHNLHNSRTHIYIIITALMHLRDERLQKIKEDTTYTN